MAGIGFGIVAGVAMDIAHGIADYAKEIKVNKRQARELANTCERLANGFAQNYEDAKKIGLKENSDAFASVFRSHVKFIGVFKAVEINMRSYSGMSSLERITHKGRMEADFERCVKEIEETHDLYKNNLSLHTVAIGDSLRQPFNTTVAPLQQTYSEARSADALEDAGTMNRITGALQTSQAADPCGCAYPRTNDEHRISEQLRYGGPKEDPLVTEARERLRTALAGFKGRFPPVVIDSSEVAMMYAEPVHCGTNSDVFRGLNQNGGLVAIKRLKFNDHADQVNKVLERISREARIWGTLDHPNIAPFFGYCRPREELPFLVSPWMENRDASTYRQTHPEVDSMKLIIGVASGLEYLHSKNIIHGSLRARHVLLDENLNPFVTDFGISRIMDDAFTWSRPPPQAWAAPEVADYEPPTAKSDVHSFASVAFELITGTWPIASRIAIRRGGTPNFPSSEDGNFRVLPDEGCRLWQLMLRCWKVTPAERPDIEDVVKELQYIAAETQEVTPPDTPSLQEEEEDELEYVDEEEAAEVTPPESSRPSIPEPAKEVKPTDEEAATVTPPERSSRREVDNKTKSIDEDAEKSSTSAERPNIPDAANEMPADREAGVTGLLIGTVLASETRMLAWQATKNWRAVLVACIFAGLALVLDFSAR